MMHEREKSDLSTVAKKLANKPGQPGAESVERREGAEANMGEPRTRRTLSRESVHQGLARVRQAARANKKERFTALLHHVSVELLKDAYSWLKRDAVSHASSPARSLLIDATANSPRVP
jgi:RNA-directed DNA polymerase